MKNTKLIWAIIISVLLVSVNVQVISNIFDVEKSSNRSKQDYIQGEWIIKWGGPYKREILEQVNILDWLPEQQVMRIKLKEGINAQQWLNQWKKDPGIKYIQPNHKLKISQIPNDTFYNKQHYLKQINAEPGWTWSIQAMWWLQF